MDAPLDSDRLRAFVAVAREQGFSRAAGVLGKTQSAVSQAVLLLERELGTRLFVRDGRKTRLTEAGAALLEHADRVLSEMAAARERLASLAELRSGTLVIGATDTLACYLLPPVLSAFRARYPHVELRLDNRPSPATAVAVAERRVDVGVVTLPLPAELSLRGRALADRVHVETLAPHEDVVICPPGHPLARAARVTVKQLGKEPLLLLDGTTGTRAFLDAAFGRARLRPRVHMEMSSVEVLKRLVALGFGVSVVPAMAVEQERATGALVALPFAADRRGRALGLVTPSPGPETRAAAAFVELLRRVPRR